MMCIKRILFIEPDQAVCAGFGEVLQGQPYDVDWAASGSSGLTLLMSRHFDLAVLNRFLPDMDGCELCGCIREMNGHLPVLMLAPTGREDMMQGFAAGADDYLPLPADAREFLARVRVLIKRALPVAREENKLKNGDVVLDYGSKQVRKGGRPVAVTASEFLLLEYMMKNKNRIVTRQELAEAAWRDQRRNKPGNVNVHMNKLRKKLKDDRYPHYLYTVSGRGYLLVEHEGK